MIAQKCSHRCAIFLPILSGLPAGAITPAGKNVLTEEKLLLVCNKGKRAYLLQNRMKFYGYTNTKVLEGGISFNEVEV